MGLVGSRQKQITILQVFENIKLIRVLTYPHHERNAVVARKSIGYAYDPFLYHVGPRFYPGELLAFCRRLVVLTARKRLRILQL